MLNNREISIVFWVIVFLVLLLVYPKTRKHIAKSIKLLTHWKIVVPNLLLYLYLYAIIVLIKKYIYWDDSLIKDSLIFVIVTSTSIFFRTANTNKPHKEIINIIFDMFKISIFIEFIYNFSSDNLLIEILIIPIGMIIGTLVYIVENNKKYYSIKKAIQTIETIFYLYLLLSSIIRFIEMYDNTQTILMTKQFFYAPILTISVIPFLYISIYCMYIERLNIFINRNKILERKFKKRLLLKYIVTSRLSLKKFIKYIHYVAYHPMFISGKYQIKEMEIFHLSQETKIELKKTESNNLILIILGIFFGILTGTVCIIMIRNNHTLFSLKNSIFVLLCYSIIFLILMIFLNIRNNYIYFNILILSLANWLGTLYTLLFLSKKLNINIEKSIFNSALIFLLSTLILSGLVLIFSTRIKKYLKYRYNLYSIEVTFSSSLLPSINNQLILNLDEIKQKLKDDYLILNRVYLKEDTRLQENYVCFKLNGIEKERHNINLDTIYYEIPEKVELFIRKYRPYFNS